ncbi:MAG: zinc metallopeptidase [Chloroflexi bacterium]|mgnify:FL=1|jgi:Zn-dependent membrane protease YugP|nr:zinc metallopeptidase [Chloroflexota bacterium]
MYWPYFNPTYFMFALPALLLGLWAQWKVRSAYGKYARVANRSGLAGFEVAQRLLASNGLTDVSLNETRGELTDHYDPRQRALHLSTGVGRTASVASMGIVAHEVGHALQHHSHYMPLKLRSALVPVVQIGSWLGPIVFMLGMVLSVYDLSVIGVVLFAGTLLFSLVTLPVELDASRRAMVMLERSGLVSPIEQQGARAVLNAAALTYVAAVIQSLSTLLYYVFLLGGSRRRR